MVPIYTYRGLVGPLASILQFITLPINKARRGTVSTLTFPQKATGQLQATLVLIISRINKGTHTLNTLQHNHSSSKLTWNVQSGKHFMSVLLAKLII